MKKILNIIVLLSLLCLVYPKTQIALFNFNSATYDSDDNNSYACSDNDQDGCEDCSSGAYDPANDGPDADGDGQCDAGDCDDDNDGCQECWDYCP